MVHVETVFYVSPHVLDISSWKKMVNKSIGIHERILFQFVIEIEILMYYRAQCACGLLLRNLVLVVFIDRGSIFFSVECTFRCDMAFPTASIT